MEKVGNASHMMQLGKFKFSVGGAAFDNLKFNTDYRWKTQESQTENSSPAMQFVGIGDQTLSLTGTIYPQLVKDGLTQIDSMRAEAMTQLPLKLTYVQASGKSDPSVGRVLGNWIIMSISEDRTLFLNDGIPREIKFSMELKRHDANTK
ncbi:phage tail protein [Pseudoalteromonas aurantia]|uniref:Phage tail protein n=1 Tax=Pseudoalteromonas aurantia 208 TaxID=1314867 RepID=A0ABR9EBC8_9GAMM|nr:phage tail protein [Pseudoalteromonas aurantia]MBE0367669.1 hypothetical protein [Pseudoalteromonas aurantia 208]